MKKLISLMLAVVMAFSITCTAFASEPPELTEEELFRQIANNGKYEKIKKVLCKGYCSCCLDGKGCISNQ